MPLVLSYDSKDYLIVLQEIGRFVLHEETEGRMPAGSASDEVQKIPLRHECHKETFSMNFKDRTQRFITRVHYPRDASVAEGQG